MLRKSVSTRVAGGALAVVIATMLTGCFANPLDAILENASEETAKNAAEEIMEGVTGGETDVSFAELPDNFPADVTLVSENVLASVTVGESTMVTVSDPRSVEELAAQVKADYSSWEQVMWSDQGVMVSALFKKSESLSVSIGIMEGSDGEDTTVGYTVIIPEKE